MKRNLFIIVGVLFLIAIVFGSTYAYYQARINSDQITNNTAKIKLELSVNKLSENATGDLIPLNNSTNNLTQAAKGYGNTSNTYDSTKSCIDKNGYTVCQIYEITIKNIGTETAVINGGITSLVGANTPNIVCAVMEKNMSVINNANCVSSTSLANNSELPANESIVYHIIVYINDTGQQQHDSGQFNGVITFSTSNDKIEANFN